METQELKEIKQEERLQPSLLTPALTVAKRSQTPLSDKPAVYFCLQCPNQDQAWVLYNKKLA